MRSRLAERSRKLAGCLGRSTSSSTTPESTDPSPPSPRSIHRSGGGRWRSTWEAPFGCSRLVLPEMVARRRGRIINVTSSAGTYRWALVSAYSVSKAALVKLTENLAAEVRRDGVSVFSFHPGLLPIGLTMAGLNSSPAPAGSALARIQQWAQQQLAAGRFSEPQDAADYVVALASSRADPLSGRHLNRARRPRLDAGATRGHRALGPAHAQTARVGDGLTPRWSGRAHRMSRGGK
jgi:hypothetical protein